MKITNEFTVHTPIERAWRLLTDLEGIAPCMPGAALTGVEGDTYQGKVKVKVGPVISEFAGTARFTEKDDTSYRAVIDAKGRDARSAGNASALVTAVLTAAGESTSVSVDTDLKISGKLAQFGSGMIKEVSGKLLAQFVANLEAKLAAEQDGPAADAAPGAANGVVDGSTATAANGSSATIAANGSAPATPNGSGPAVVHAESTTANAVAVDTSSGAAIASAPAAPAVTPESSTPSAPAKPAVEPPPTAPAAEPVSAGWVSAGSATAGEGVAASDPDLLSSAGSASTGPAGPATSASAASASGSVAPAARTFAAGPEPEALDLLEIAGGSIYKRLIPVAGVVVVVGAVIVWLVARR